MSQRVLDLDTGLELIGHIDKAKSILRPLASLNKALGLSTLNIDIALDGLEQAGRTIAKIARDYDVRQP